jgi:hypothetical protein
VNCGNLWSRRKRGGHYHEPRSRTSSPDFAPPCIGLLAGVHTPHGKRPNTTDARRQGIRGNAIGICIIHAVISANDAITIHLGEVRSSSEQHADAQRLLLEVAKKVPEKVLRAYASVVQAKFEYEYSGDVFTPSTARRLLVKAEVFYDWVREQLR